MEKAYTSSILDNGDISVTLIVNSDCTEVLQSIDESLTFEIPSIQSKHLAPDFIKILLRAGSGFTGACSIAYAINKIEHVISIFAKKVEDSEHYVSKIEKDLETKDYGRL